MGRCAGRIESVKKRQTISRGQSCLFEEVKKSELPKSTLELDFILDIPLFLHVELGSTRMLISELLQLGQGSVIEMTKLAGEPMDVFVNQRLIARGEVVVVNEKIWGAAHRHCFTGRTD